MKHKLAHFILAFALLFTPVLLSPVAAAAACPSSSTPKGQALNGIGETGGDCDGSGVNDLLKNIVDILSMVVGAAAVIMIIIAGLKYVTSGGDSGSVSSAKSTLIYALVGIAVAALAQVLVKLALHATA
jgi:hypothetical protein